MVAGVIPFAAPAAIDGIRIGTAEAAIKRAGRRDLVVFEIEAGAACAAVFTRNQFCAAPVVLARDHLRQSPPRFLLINSGNANAGTGEQGMLDAKATCALVGELGDCDAACVLPFSTGVIGQPLPVERFRSALPSAFGSLRGDGWGDAAHAIMTTDTVPKALSRQVVINGIPVTVSGIAKGAGMIRPDMATMLGFIATDAAVEPVALQRMLETAMSRSFNRITVDGDTSTNDACVLIATGKAANTAIRVPLGEEGRQLQSAIDEVCVFLAEAIVRDGEGATKFIRIAVSGGGDEQECRAVAYTIAHSPLVKTAFFASDANWGRILAAIGRAGLQDLDIGGVRIHINGVCIVENGGRAAGYSEEAGTAAMQPTDITIAIDLGRGSAVDAVMTCDFSFDYVRINAEYRT
jgi:glutamate N-acetyltransferase / amino-acid N-acetyltransferase